MDDSEIINVPFSFKDFIDSEDSTNFCNHPVVKKLRELFTLDVLCGYIMLLKLYNCSTCSLLKQNSNASLVENEKEKTDMIFDEENIEISSFFASNNKTKNFNSSIAKDPRYFFFL